MIHLRGVQLLPPRASQPEDDRYPFAVPAVASLRTVPLEFDAPVTFLVGENGSGKSAILEGLACAAGSIAIAGDDPRRDPTLAAARALGDRLRLSRARPHPARVLPARRGLFRLRQIHLDVARRSQGGPRGAERRAGA